MSDGVSSKQIEFEKDAPITVLELVRIPGLGAKTARKLFQENGIAGLTDLKAALDSGFLAEIPGIGPKMIDTIRQFTTPS